MKKIDKFKGEYRWLSNFYDSPIKIGHLEYTSVEHCYQCSKAINAYDYNIIYNTDSPAKAKKIANTIELRKDWELVKLSIMFQAVLCKFLQNEELRTKLIATGNVTLIEGNTWGDTFWGVCDGKGKNWLGRILMIVRSFIHDKNYMDSVKHDIFFKVADTKRDLRKSNLSRKVLRKKSR